VDEIEEHLQGVGFVPHVEMKPNGNDVEALGLQQERFDEFDLVVVDYDLGHPEQNGDWVAKQVRRHFGFTDIIFYSGKKPGELRKLVYDGGIDGVYCFNRPELAMRGLAMGIVGRCDDDLRSLLTTAFGKLDGDGREKMEAKLDSLVASAREIGQKKFEQCKTFDEKLSSRSVTSFTLYKMGMFLLDGKAHCADQRAVLTAYDPEVLEPRNRLAHAIETKTAEGWVVETPSKPDITLADFPKLRTDLARHLGNIRSLAPLLQDGGQQA